MFSDFYHIGSAISFFLGLVILIRQDKTISNYILSFWLLIMGINIFLFHRLIDHQESESVLTLANYFLLSIQISATLIYIRSFLYSKSKTILFSIKLIGIPTIIICILTLIFGINIFKPSINIYENHFITLLLFVYIIIAMPIYLILSLYSIKKIKNITLQLTSDIYEADFEIIKQFIYGILLAYICFLLLFISSFIFNNITINTAFGSSIVILSLSVIYAGVFGLQKTEIFTVHNNIKNVENQKPCKHDTEQLQEIMDKLNTYMIEKKPFLRPRLSLKELSEITKIPENQISSAINIIKRKNFYDYINYFRIKEFIQKIKTKDRFDYTLTAIAFECGFNSKSAFYKIFKDYTGQTPSQFIKNL